ENEHVPHGVNNVNIFPFAGELVASGDTVSGPPVTIDPITLETKGVVSWSPDLSKGLHEKVCFGDGAFCAHPKWDEDTGILYGWSYSDTKPYVSMKYIHPDGTVESRDLWDAPYASVVHDAWLTPEWVVMPFSPFLMDRKRPTQGKAIFDWDPELPMVIA